VLGATSALNPSITIARSHALTVLSSIHSRSLTRHGMGEPQFTLATMFKKIVLALAPALALALLPTSTPANAADCEVKTCIEVYVKDGRIVIEGRRGSGPTSSTTTNPAPKRTVKPRVSASPTPKPRVSAPASAPKTRKRAPKVSTPKASTSSSTTPAQSLFDKLVESIPTSGISYQPSFSPLVKTSVYFWSDVPTVLTKRVKILDEIVDIKLKPNFIWHYGDGVIFATRDVGAAFPNGKIQHTYSKPGHYLIQLITHWSGEFTVSGVSTPIPSELISVAILPISVVTAPIRFMN
jgi:hypothetical protein